MNVKHLPGVIELIIENAFGWEQALGGGIGMALMQGIKRGLFSNEAGMGSAPNVAATADVTHPVKQGLIQTLGVLQIPWSFAHVQHLSFFSAGWRLQEKPTELN